MAKLDSDLFILINSIQEKGMLKEYYAFLQKTKAKSDSKLYKTAFDAFLDKLDIVELDDISKDVVDEIEKKLGVDHNKTKQRLKDKIIKFITWYYKKTKQEEEEQDIDSKLWEAKALYELKFSPKFSDEKMREVDIKIKKYSSDQTKYLDAGLFARYVEQLFYILREKPTQEEFSTSNYNRILILLTQIYRFSRKELLYEIKHDFTPNLIYRIVGEYCFEENEIGKRLQLINNQIDDIRLKDAKFDKSLDDIRIEYLEVEKLILSFKQGKAYSLDYLNSDSLANKTLRHFAKLMLEGSEGKLFFTKADIDNIAERLELNRILALCSLSYNSEPVLSLAEKALKNTIEIFDFVKNKKIKVKLLLIKLICQIKLKQSFKVWEATLEEIRNIRKEHDEFDKILLEYLEKNNHALDKTLNELKKGNERFDNPFANAILELLGK